MNIAKIEDTALNNLPESLKAIVIARQGKPFNKMELGVQKRVCLNVITKAHFDAGDKGGTEPSVLMFQSNALLEELKGKYG